MVYDIIPAVEADKTLEAYDQYMRFDWIDTLPIPQLQLCLDRRHLVQRWKSKPFGYITISNPQQLNQLAINSLVSVLIDTRARAKDQKQRVTIESLIDNWLAATKVKIVQAVHQIERRLGEPERRQATLDEV
jgi:hypothetical protein